jgi:hypothetical protein
MGIGNRGMGSDGPTHYYPDTNENDPYSGSGGSGESLGFKGCLFMLFFVLLPFLGMLGSFIYMWLFNKGNNFYCWLIFLISFGMTIGWILYIRIYNRKKWGHY